MDDHWSRCWRLPFGYQICRTWYPRGRLIVAPDDVPLQLLFGGRRRDGDNWAADSFVICWSFSRQGEERAQDGEAGAEDGDGRLGHVPDHGVNRGI